MSCLFLSQLIKEIELPKGVVNIITGDHTVGGQLVNSKDLEMISFTGSGKTGSRIIEEGAKTNLKKVTVELGGKSCVIVDKDCDVD